MRALAPTLLVLALGSAACNKHKATCDTYVDLAMKCDEGKTFEGDERRQLEQMIGGMCIAAFDGEYAGATGEAKQMMVEMYDHIKSVAGCAEQATTCEAYKQCEERADKK